MQPKLTDVTPHQIDAFRRLLMHLPDTADIGLVVLKGHLLLEEQLRIIIEERMKKPSALKLDNREWGFAQILSLAEALCSGEIHDEIWECVRKINKIRNEMAHKLEPKGLEDRIRALNKTWPVTSQETDIKSALFMTLSSIFVEISRLVKNPSNNVIELIRAE